MNEESMLKRTLVLTGKLLGLSVVWVALLSFVTVFVTGQAVSSLPSSQSDKAATVPAESGQDAAKKDSSGAARAKNPANNAAPNKPNG
ncbi:MAG: hypothetical protein ABW133_09190 [Polyangiaceae bacterium]